MKVRIKDNNSKCPAIQFGGATVYHGTNWTEVEDKYRSKAESDIRLEVLKEDNDVQNVKEEINKQKEIKENIEEVKKVENKQESINDILTAHWIVAKKHIGTITDIDFLEKYLLPELEKANKSALIETCKNRIQELNNDLNNN